MIEEVKTNIVNDESSLEESLLLEKTRQELINKSRNADNYTSKGRENQNRYTRRLKSQISNSVRDYNRIDMDAFWKGDILDFDVHVHGETNDYVVKITFENILDELQNEVKRNNNKLEFKCVLRALLKAFNGDDVYISCSCLHPGTKIKLLDGTNPTIEEMKQRFDNGEKLYVYSTDANGDFKPGEVEKVWITKTTSDFIKITLDNEEEIITTPDHLYMLRDGSYMQAENLVEGQSLMPMYFNEANGYTLVKPNTVVRGWKSVYKEVANYFKENEIIDAKERAKLEEDSQMNYDVAIHHIDFNKHNNNPENLKIMTAKEHWDYHASLCGENRQITEHMREVCKENAYKRNANPTQKMIESRKKWQEKGRLRNYDEDRKQLQSKVLKKLRKDKSELFTTEELSKRMLKAFEDHPDLKERISRGQKNAWSNYSPEEYLHRCEINRQNNIKSRDKRSKAIKNVRANLSEERKQLWNQHNSEGIKKSWKEHPERYLTEKFKLARHNAFKFERTPEVILKLNKSKIGTILQLILKDALIPTPELYDEYRLTKVAKGYPKWQKVFDSWKSVSDYYNLNHKVAKVERIILSETPVYDIKVKEWENFVVDAGVVLHNCPDWKYRIAYWATRNQQNSGTPEVRPSDITNPRDTKGAGCKHSLLVISNLDWMMKIASVINNYIKYCRDNMARNYADYIFPKVYGVPYNRAVQLSLFDKEDKYGDGILPSDQATINDVIAQSLKGKDERGRWTRGNQYRFEPKPKSTTPDQEKDNALNLKFGDENVKDVPNDRKELSLEDEEI